MKTAVFAVAMTLAYPAAADSQVISNSSDVGSAFYQCKSEHKCQIDLCGSVSGFQEPHGGIVWTTGCNLSGIVAIVDPDHNAQCAIAVANACDKATP
jgi:hypothetical protein